MAEAGDTDPASLARRLNLIIPGGKLRVAEDDLNKLLGRRLGRYVDVRGALGCTPGTIEQRLGRPGPRRRRRLGVTMISASALTADGVLARQLFDVRHVLRTTAGVAGLTLAELSARAAAPAG